ncbi:DUF4192 domain-containing protein [Actinoplanes sp. NPDC049596]|uniref:DUF4192 domain-containing protein n=1 Tax=unclassified Actinoplanes TaxID=2626549 RepID=UPI0034350001
MTPECSISVRNPAELITVTPFVIGFHPTDSIVVIGVAGGLIAFVARHDLPPPGEELDPGRLAAVTGDQGIGTVAIIGYGEAARVTRAVERTIPALRANGLFVFEALRVTEGRWWSYLCPEPECCPPEGTRCLRPDDPIAATAVFKGMVALPNRKALEGRVAPVDGEARAAMVVATARARVRAAELRAAGREGHTVPRAGRLAVREAEKKTRARGALTDDEVAWLGVLLVDAVVLGYAADRFGPEPWRIDLWTAVLRRVEPGFVAGPASLLAHAAWRAGDGALARVALDRGLREEPGHRLLGVIDGLLAAGIGPQSVEDFAPPPRPARRQSPRRSAPRTRTESSRRRKPRKRDGQARAGERRRQ